MCIKQVGLPSFHNIKQVLAILCVDLQLAFESDACVGGTSQDLYLDYTLFEVLLAPSRILELGRLLTGAKTVVLRLVLQS